MLGVLAAFLLLHALKMRSQSRDTPWRHLARDVLICGALAGALLAPFVLPMLKAIHEAGSSQAAARAEHENVTYNSADLVAHLVPDHTMAPWRGWWLSEGGQRVQREIDISLHGSRFERSVYPGWLSWIALAAVAGSARLRRRLWPWLALYGLAFVITLGPSLFVYGHLWVDGWLPAGLLARGPFTALLRSSSRFSVFAMLGAGIAVSGVIAELKHRVAA